MRRNDLSGAKAWMGAVLVMRSRMLCRLSGRKTSGLVRFVNSRVLDGGVGWTSGGRLDRSSVRLALREADDEDRDGRGVGSMASLGM